MDSQQWNGIVLLAGVCRRMSSVVVCNAAGGRGAGPAAGALAVGRPTLHGGPVVLRPVRAILCFIYVLLQLFKATRRNNTDNCDIIMLTASSRKRDVTVWRPSVCPVGILIVTRQGAACDAASVHFGPTIRRTDILVYCKNDTVTDNVAVPPSKVVRQLPCYPYRCMASSVTKRP